MGSFPFSNKLKKIMMTDAAAEMYQKQTKKKSCDRRQQIINRSTSAAKTKQTKEKAVTLNGKLW